MFADLFWTATIVGIWPRFIEPKLIFSTKLNLPIKNLPKSLEGLKIVHFTDLHFRRKTSSRFLQKLSKKITQENPDLIFFTGDFICYSHLVQKQKLKTFLSSLSASYGCFCSLGNHDYGSYVSRSPSGEYKIAKPPLGLRGLLRRGLKSCKKLLGKSPYLTSISPQVAQVQLHTSLLELLKTTPFKLLENACTQIAIGRNRLNICGLGDYALGRCVPQKAFEGYALECPGIVLSHNPDSITQLKDYPGEIILSGHTHGEQIHFPFPRFLRALSRRFVGLENKTLTRGLFRIGKKHLYVNRGVGAHQQFRLFSPPEICIIRVKGC